MKSEYNTEQVVSCASTCDQQVHSTVIALNNEFAFTEIVHTYFSKLLGIAFRITKSRQTAEDIVQETFLKLWQRQAEIVNDSLGPWLYKVVINSSYKHVKRESRKIQLLDFLKTDRQTMYTDVEEHLTSKETAAFFDQALRKLPERQQMVYQLSRRKGLSRDEIADHLNISPNTVKVHLLRAVKFIKEYMAVASLFFVFFVFNNIIFSRSNTNSRPRDIYKVEHIIEKKLLGEIANRFSYIQRVASEKK